MSARLQADKPRLRVPIFQCRNKLCLSGTKVGVLKERSLRIEQMSSIFIVVRWNDFAQPDEVQERANFLSYQAHINIVLRVSAQEPLKFLGSSFKQFDLIHDAFHYQWPD